MPCVPGKMRDSSPELAFWRHQFRMQQLLPYYPNSHNTSWWVALSPHPRLGEVFKTIKEQSKGTVKDVEVRESGIQAPALLPQWCVQ